MGKEALQWHPAFYAGLQIELQEDKENLIFENEHQLGTKPKEIDVLVIKKEKDIPVKKNIGKIFRKYNIVEYKSPTDYLSIDSFYKGCAYAYFYKSDTEQQDAIPIDEITLTFLSAQYPKRLMEHLREVCGYRIEERYKGIYYIQKESDILPTQLIVTSRVSEEENMWLWSLTNKLEKQEEIRRLIDEYQRHKSNTLYESVMDIIVRANYQEFEEVRGSMCKALEELMADVIAERQKEAIEQGLAQGIAQGIEKGMAQGIEQGIEQGKKQMILNMLSRGTDVEEIAQIAQMPVETIEELAKERKNK